MKLDINIDDLSENCRDYASIIGIDALLELSKHYGGTSIYIPQSRELEKADKYKKIVNEFENGRLSVAQIARKYATSKSTVYKLLKGKTNVRKKNIEGQMDIFEFIDK